MSWGWGTPIQQWRRGSSPLTSPGAFLGAAGCSSSSSTDTGRSFPLCLDSCRESIPAEKQHFTLCCCCCCVVLTAAGPFISGSSPGCTQRAAAASSAWAAEMPQGLGKPQPAQPQRRRGAGASLRRGQAPALRHRPLSASPQRQTPPPAGSLLWRA